MPGLGFSPCCVINDSRTKQDHPNGRVREISRDMTDRELSLGDLARDVRRRQHWRERPRRAFRDGISQREDDNDGSSPSSPVSQGESVRGVVEGRPAFRKLDSYSAYFPGAEERHLDFPIETRKREKKRIRYPDPMRHLIGLALIFHWGAP